MSRYLALAGALTVAIATGAPPPATADLTGVVARGYTVRQIVAPSGMQISNGIAVAPDGDLIVTHVLQNALSRVDPASGLVETIAHDRDGQDVQLQSPDDVTFGADGSMYVTEPLVKRVTKIDPDGVRTRLAGAIGDARTVPNGIAFRGARLFAVDMSFDPSHEGGMFELDPNGVLPARPIMRGIFGAQGFAFGPDGLAYVPEFAAGTIAVADVDAGTVVRRIEVGGTLAALDIDALGRIVAVQADTGAVLRGTATGSFATIAQGPSGLDNLAFGADGTIYVSSYLRGGLSWVDETTGTLRPVVAAGAMTFPVSLSPASDGGIWVANFNAVRHVSPAGAVRAATELFLSALGDGSRTLFNAGAVEIDGALYFADSFPSVDQRISRLDLTTGRISAVTRATVLPTHLRAGPSGSLLALDQFAGTVSLIDPATGATVPLIAGLVGGAGLAVGDGTVYVAESGAGVVWGIDLATRTRIRVASGLVTPEGLALDEHGGLLVVEGDAGRLVRIDRRSGLRSVVASGLPTDTRGITSIPNFNLSADVLVRPDGEIVVCGNADGSVIGLRRN